jgi:hypothetical protein
VLVAQVVPWLLVVPMVQIAFLGLSRPPVEDMDIQVEVCTVLLAEVAAAAAAITLITLLMLAVPDPLVKAMQVVLD